MTDSVYVVMDSFDGERRTGGAAQLLNPRDDEMPTRRAFVWADMMRKLAPTRRLEFRFFAVPVRDERQAQSLLRRQGVALPW